MVVWKYFFRVGTAIYTYEATKDRQVSLSIGDQVQIIEETNPPGWFRGYLLNGSERNGIFPSSYISIKPVNNKKESITYKITETLSEWNFLLNKSFLNLEFDKYELLKSRILSLLKLHRLIKTKDCTKERKKELNQKVLIEIEEGFWALDNKSLENNNNNNNIIQLNQEISLSSLLKMREEIRLKRKRLEDSNSSNKNSFCFVVGAKPFKKSDGFTTEISFFLYDKISDRIITEEFRVSFNSKGVPVLGTSKLSTIFANIKKSEINGDQLVVVCQAIKIAKIVDKTKEKRENSGSEYRRPLGVAILPIDSTVLSKIINREQEFSLTIFSGLQEHQFSNLHELLIKRSANLLVVSKNLTISLAFYEKDFPALSSVALTNRMDEEIITPETNRNDFYVIIEEGEFLQEKKTNANNIEITLQLRKSSGEVIKDSIISSSGISRSDYKSFIYVNINNPKWSETIRFNIQPSIVEQVHVFFTIRHCQGSSASSEVISNSYLKVTNGDGTVISDGLHSLECFKNKNSDNPSVYMKEVGAKPAIRRGEILKVRTFLSSNKLTQSSTMHSLLSWKSNVQKLTEILNQFAYVNGLDVMKFLKETLDAMFEMLETKQQTVTLLVYNSLVHVIGLIVDDKGYKSFTIVIDEYLQKSFKWTTIHKYILMSFKTYLAEILVSSPKASKLLPTMKSMEYLIKIIVTSYKQIKGDGPIKSEMKVLFKSLGQMMTKQNTDLLPLQIFAIRNFFESLKHLILLFDVKELCEISQNFIESIFYMENSKSLHLEKLKLLNKIISEDLFKNEICGLLLFMFLKQIKQHISNSIEEMNECILLIISIFEKDKLIKNDTSILLFLELLPEISRRIQSIESIMEIKIELIVSFLSICDFIEFNIFKNYVMNQSNSQDFLKSILISLQHLINPKKVTISSSMSQLCRKIVRKMIVMIRNIIIDTNFPKMTILQKEESQDNVTNVTTDYLTEWIRLSILYLSIENIENELERNEPEDFITFIRNIWKLEENSKNIYLINDFISLLDKKQEYESLVIEIYFDLYKDPRKCQQVELNTIESIENSVNNIQIIQTILCTKIGKLFIGEDEISMKGRTFMKFIKKYSDLLIDFSKKSEENEKIQSLLQILNFLKESNRISSYIKYVFILSEYQFNFGNYQEGALTLLLESDFLPWDDFTPDFVNQGDSNLTNSMIKERSYRKSIEYLKRGKKYEKTLELIRELKNYYENIAFNYSKLAEMTNIESFLFKKIQEKIPISFYFKVSYLGKGFDEEKEFIFKALDLLNVEEFYEKIMKRYPMAELLTSIEFPEDLSLNTKQYIQINEVRSATKEEIENLKRITSNGILKNTSSTNLSLNKSSETINNTIFVQKRLFSKSKLKDGNFSPALKLREMWSSNVYYFIEDCLPIISTSSKIIKKIEIELHPIESSIELIQSKSRDLLASMTRNESLKAGDNTSFINILKEAIQFMNNEMVIYAEAFWGSDYSREVDKIDSIILMKEEFRNYSTILDKLIRIRSSIYPIDIKMQLEEDFTKGKTALKI